MVNKVLEHYTTLLSLVLKDIMQTFSPEYVLFWRYITVYCTVVDGKSHLHQLTRLLPRDTLLAGTKENLVISHWVYFLKMSNAKGVSLFAVYIHTKLNFLCITKYNLGVIQIQLGTLALTVNPTIWKREGGGGDLHSE